MHTLYNSWSLACSGEKCPNWDAFKLVTAMLVSWYISAGVLSRLASYPWRNSRGEMGQFAERTVTYLNILCLVWNFFLQLGMPLWSTAFYCAVL